MFDKTFFKFALGFAIIIVVSFGVVYIAQYFGLDAGGPQTATAK